MKSKRREEGDANLKPLSPPISFPPGVYETLERIAREKKASLAWVVREAAEKYIADKWPLFQPPKGV